MDHRQSEHELFPVKINGKVELSPHAFLISWKKRDAFKAGQVIKIAMDQETPPRIYSICSGSEEEEMSVLFDVRQQGFLTPKLAEAKLGSTIYISQPYGSFIGDHTPAYWIAAGTGIAPFYSMFKSGLATNKVLIHGARHLNQFFFQDEFKPEFDDQYIRCCSLEQAPDVFPGRITSYLSGREDLPKDFLYYLCGGGMMVIDVRDLLIEKGIPYEHIISEIYF